MAYTTGDYAKRGKAKSLTVPYLRRRFGRPEYRRRVPGWLQPIIGVTEWCEALSQDHEEARRECAALTRRHDRLTSPDIRRLVRSEGGSAMVVDALVAMMMEPLTAEGMPSIDEALAMPNDDMRLLVALRREVESAAADDAAMRTRLRPLKDAIDGTEAPPTESTLGDVVTRWLKDSKYPPSTKDTYEPRIRRALEFFGNDLPVKTLTSKMVREWRDQVAQLPGQTGLPAKLRTAPMSALLRYAAEHSDTTKPIMPNAVRDHLKALQACMAWAVDEEIISSNPTTGVKPPKDARDDVEETRHPALPWREMPAFMCELRSRHETLARALEFAILCAARTSEVVGMEWSEIDLAAKTWTCPASRVKSSRETHIVPLSDRALAVLGEPGEGPVFGAIPSNGLLRFLQRQMARPDITTHGFRSAFATWAAEATEYPDEMREIALAHRVGSEVSRRYRRGSMIERRRAMMEDWASFCMSTCKAD
jgi:integrase